MFTSTTTSKVFLTMTVALFVVVMLNTCEARLNGSAASSAKRTTPTSTAAVDSSNNKLRGGARRQLTEAEEEENFSKMDQQYQEDMASKKEAHDIAMADVPPTHVVLKESMQLDESIIIEEISMQKATEEAQEEVDETVIAVSSLPTEDDIANDPEFAALLQMKEEYELSLLVAQEEDRLRKEAAALDAQTIHFAEVAQAEYETELQTKQMMEAEHDICHGCDVDKKASEEIDTIQSLISYEEQLQKEVYEEQLRIDAILEEKTQASIDRENRMKALFSN